ncbi:MAG: hypothetical protein L0H25_06920 [Micrococcales bacterium]|nr:hypothetical protein [Micrococcales bacterium]
MTDPARLQAMRTSVARGYVLLGIAACPECGRLADVVDRFVLPSTDGPLEHIRLRCDGGRHHLTLIIEGNLET